MDTYFPKPRFACFGKMVIQDVRLHEMKKTMIVMVVMGFLVLPSEVQARSYGFLRDAIREYTADSNPETEARLHAAQRKAFAIDIVIVLIPIAVGAYVIVRMRQGKRKRESNKTLDGTA